ncbi:MAG: GGDEF domain-containing protein, partial [Aeromonadaceae bacterium]
FLIDVNGLKEINDTRGHEAGDALLKTVAERLRYCLQGMTGSLYRIGGDEFVILLEGDGVEQTQELMARLQQTQFRPATLAGREYGISFSVGYADSHKIPFSLLYKMADKAMYQQKQAYYEHKHAQRASGLEDSSESV